MRLNQKNNNCTVQRVPALRVFWDLEKTVLHETRVSGTVLWSPTNANSPTYTKITNTVSTTTVFGLCTCKCGIFALVGDLLQFHKQEFYVTRFFPSPKMRVRWGPSVLNFSTQFNSNLKSYLSQLSFPEFIFENIDKFRKKIIWTPLFFDKIVENFKN